MPQILAHRSLALGDDRAPFGECVGCASGERERPGEGDQHRDERGAAEKHGAAPRTPLGADEMRSHHGQRQRKRRHRACREKRETEREAEDGARARGLARGERQRRERAAHGGERGELRQRLVRVHEEPDAAEEQQERTACGRAAQLRLAPVARGTVDEHERRADERAAREARGGVELDERAQQLAEGERDPVIEGLVVEPALAGDARHDEIAAQRHAVHDAEADRVLRLPEVVAGESRQDEHRRDDRECGSGRRQRDPGRHSPGSYLGFLV